MGQSKDRMMEDDRKLLAAEEIAVRAGLLAECKMHSYTYYTDGGSFEEAYKIANKLITSKDPLVDCFSIDNRSELTDLIKNIKDISLKECPDCKKSEKE